MKKKLLSGFIGSVIALSFGLASAQPMPPPGPQGGPDHMDGRRGPDRIEARRAPYRIQHRIDAQQREIRQGMRNGSLNRREATILRNNINRIKQEYNRAKRTDRYVSMEERARLDNILDRNERMIRRMENNAITRF